MSRFVLGIWLGIVQVLEAEASHTAMLTTEGVKIPISIPTRIQTTHYLWKNLL